MSDDEVERLFDHIVKYELALEVQPASSRIPVRKICEKIPQEECRRPIARGDSLILSFLRRAMKLDDKD